MIIDEKLLEEQMQEQGRIEVLTQAREAAPEVMWTHVFHSPLEPGVIIVSSLISPMVHKMIWLVPNVGWAARYGSNWSYGKRTAAEAWEFAKTVKAKP